MEYFVLIKFCEEEVDCVSSKYIEDCGPIEELAVNSVVRVKSYGRRTKRDDEGSYYGEVLAKSESRPIVVSLMDTYIKTGDLPDADPNKRKRPRIPKSFSEDEVENEEPGKILQKKKSKKNILKLAQKTAAQRILAEVGEYGFTSSSAAENREQCSSCILLKKEIKDLKGALKKANRERDDAYGMYPQSSI